MGDLVLMQSMVVPSPTPFSLALVQRWVRVYLSVVAPAQMLLRVAVTTTTCVEARVQTSSTVVVAMM